MSAYEGVHDQDPRHTRYGQNNQKGILKSCTRQKYGDHEVIENLYYNNIMIC